MILPIAPALRKHIELLSTSDDPDAPIHPRACLVLERQGRSGSLSNQFADLLSQAGLRERKSHHKAPNGLGRSAHRAASALSFHCLRHTVTSFLHARGIPAAIAQAFVGHDSQSMHELYVHVGMESLSVAANALPEV